MSAELDAMGGGDTRVAKVEGYCRVHPSVEDPNGSILSVDYDRSIVVVRDPRAAGSTPHAKGVRKYQVNSILREPNSVSEVCRSALNWFWDGFNANIISLGQTGTSKSLSLWGRTTASDDAVFPPLLEEVFARIDEAGDGEYRVGLSCWDILGNDVVDLFSTDHSKSHNFGRKYGAHTARSVLTVNAGSLENAMKLIDLARSRSVNWTTATPTNRPEFMPNRAHHCVRVVLHNASAGWVSNLHIVDLVGHGRSPSHAPPFNHGDLERERRIARQQLVGFGRIIAELSKTAPDSKEAGPTLVSARDSVLSQLVGPLLTTNSKTLFLTCVSPHKDDFAETVHSLQFVKRAQSITIGCAKTLGVVDDSSLEFVAEDQVLTLDQVWPSPNGHAPTPHQQPQQPRYPTPPISADVRRSSPRNTAHTLRQYGDEEVLKTASIDADEEDPRRMSRNSSHQRQQAHLQPQIPQQHSQMHRQNAKPPSQIHHPHPPSKPQLSVQKPPRPSPEQSPIQSPNQSPRHHSPHSSPRHSSSPQHSPQHFPYPTTHASPQHSPHHFPHQPLSRQAPPHHLPSHPSPRQSPQHAPHHSHPSPRHNRLPSPKHAASSPRNESFIGEELSESDISLLSVHDLSSTREGGFEAAEKHRRRDGVGGRDEGRAGQTGRRARREGDNTNTTNVTNIKQKMRNMINVLENEEPQEEEEGEGEEEANSSQVYSNNNNNMNGKRGNQFQENEDMYNSNTHIPTRPNESWNAPHPASHELNSSSMMAELVMLKKNYESVLKALDRAETLKSQFANKAAEAEHRVTEIQLQYQLQLDEVAGESIFQLSQEKRRERGRETN